MRSVRAWGAAAVGGPRRPGRDAWRHHGAARVSRRGRPRRGGEKGARVVALPHRGAG
jgi:hypothetical protein